jgi:hypothetical protein
MKANGGFCKFRPQPGTVTFSISPRVHLFYRTTTGALGTFHTPVALIPWSIPDPAVAAEPFQLSGFSTFRAKAILDTHSE